jgi:dihydrofolate synthase/folylpolyglutamate synthase
MSYQECLTYLDSLTDHAKHLHLLRGHEFSLDRLSSFLTSLGNPEKKLNIIHIAGSKGKGSISILTASVLRAAGYKTGVYTSPHLYDVRERIRVLMPEEGGKNQDDFEGMIPEAALQQLVASLKKIHDSDIDKGLKPLTYFEFLTALAFVYFKEQEVDFVIMETGLGGRLDATNTADAMISVITPISLEHTNILGNTLEAIANEKAAIIKSTARTAVIAPQTDGVRDLIIKRCEAQKVRFVDTSRSVKLTARESTIRCQIFDISGFGEDYPDISTPLLGKHQQDNVAVAFSIVSLLKEFGYVVHREAVYKGFAGVKWPGRFEVIRESPLIVLDAAHNDVSAAVLSRTIFEVCGEKKAIAVIGISADKDLTAFAKALTPAVKKVIGTASGHPRARILNANELAELFPDKETLLISNVHDACEEAVKKMAADDIIVVTGSIFVVAEARKVFKKLLMDKKV